VADLQVCSRPRQTKGGLRAATLSPAGPKPLDPGVGQGTDMLGIPLPLTPVVLAVHLATMLEPRLRCLQPALQLLKLRSTDHCDGHCAVPLGTLRRSGFRDESMAHPGTVGMIDCVAM
jgi:hypothetical protein